VIFYHTPQQRQTAEEVAERLDQSGAFAAPIVTEITPFSNFFPAEDFHQDYFSLHGREPYCQLVIHPKLEKFRHAFPGQLKQH
jgi:peptide-methionine (S)-S-oxide reductase